MSLRAVCLTCVRATLSQRDGSRQFAFVCGRNGTHRCRAVEKALAAPLISRIRPGGPRGAVFARLPLAAHHGGRVGLSLNPARWGRCGTAFANVGVRVSGWHGNSVPVTPDSWRDVREPMPFLSGRSRLYRSRFPGRTASSVMPPALEFTAAKPFPLASGSAKIPAKFGLLVECDPRDRRVCAHRRQSVLRGVRRIARRCVSHRRKRLPVPTQALGRGSRHP